MKNELLSNGKLVLVNSSGETLTGQDIVDDAAFAYGYDAENEDSLPAASYRPRQTLIVFMAVSLACAAAAIASGTYALWLSRQQATKQALTDVNDLLKICKSRMEQLEYDVQHLPRRA